MCPTIYVSYINKERLYTINTLYSTVLNTSIVMCLRDNRNLDYKDSIIEVVQARLNDGPVYFQYS